MGTKFMGFGYLAGGILKGFSFPSGTTAFGLLYSWRQEEFYSREKDAQVGDKKDGNPSPYLLTIN